MIFSRKTIFVAGAVLLAACGDKVTVAGPTPVVPPAAVVNSVSVAPTAATLSIGQNITLTAAVNATAGVATTVTWAASASNVTVSSAGVVTAVTATPGVAVCATSTVDTGKKGCATIVVTAATNPIPATVSIQSITKGGLTTPVDPSNVSGQMDVTLNVNPGNQTISKVVLLVGGVRVDSQTFSAAQAAALRFSADEAVAAQTTFPQIVFSVNTAFYNATTGAVRFLNGAKAVSAQLYTTQGGTATAASASAQTNLTFANVDGFAVTTSGGSSAVDALGYRWNGNGSLTVNAIPVMYSGSTIGTVNASLAANGACTAVGAIGSATTATAGAYVITGALAGLQSPATCTTTTPNLINITATNATGDNLTLVATGVLSTQTGLRWDNVAPAFPAGSSGVLRINVNPNGRAGSWLNDAVTLNTAASAAGTTLAAQTAADRFICGPVVGAFGVCLTTDTLPRDAGVGGAAVSVQVSTTKTLATTAAAITNTSALAMTTTAAGYCAVAYSADLLGNKTASPSTATACGAEANNAPFGVDRVAPIVSFGAGSMASNFQGPNTVAMTNYRVTHVDTGLVGNSGFGTATAAQRGVLTTSSRRSANAAAVAFAPAFSLAAVAGLAPDTLVVDMSGGVTDGYYTTTVIVRDNAGNASAPLSRVALRDWALPTLLVPTQTNVALTGGSSQTFTSSGTDANDLASASAVIPFASVASGPFLVANSTINTYNTTPAVTATGVSVTVPFFVRGMQTIGAAADSVTVNAMTAPGNMTMNLFDAAGNVASQAYTMQNVAAATAYTGAQITKLWISGNGSISNGTGTSANPTSRTFVLNQSGPIVATPLFTKVELFRYNATLAAYVSAGSTTTPTGVVDAGLIRTTSWSIPFTPGTAWGSGAQNMLMVGYNANGDAVTVFTPVSVTISNP